jgi:hypothetical protein
VIELFDAQRLRPRADRSLALAGAALLVTAVALGAYGWSLDQRMQGLERQRAALEQGLQQGKPAPAPSASLLADLQRQAERLEAESGVEAGPGAAAPSPPSSWLQRLAGLASADLSLVRIEIERSGVVQIEGLALSPQAVSRFLQAWDQAQPQGQPLPARAVEVRQDSTAEALLRFKLRASTAAAQVGP